MPYKKKYIRGDQLPWITPEISSAITRRNILFRKFKRVRSEVNWEQFKKQRNIVTTLKRKSMKSFCIQASAECTHPGEFWKKFKPLLPSKCVQHQAIQLLEEGRFATNNMEVANIFNSYFTDGVAAHIPILHENAFASHLSIIEIHRRFRHLEFSFHHVAVGYVKKLLDSLKPNKATGPDKISHGFLWLPLRHWLNHLPIS